MIEFNELKKDVIILFDGSPHKVLDAKHIKKARQGATVTAKLKNLINGNTKTETFGPSDKLEGADIQEKEIVFIYEHRGNYVFHKKGDKSDRFSLTESEVGGKDIFLKNGMTVTAQYFEDKLVNIVLPIKVDYKVREAPPVVKGNTAEGGTKQVTIESGATVATPLFINTGDIIRVNTQKREYVERVEKAR